MLALHVTKVGENPLFRFMQGCDSSYWQANGVPTGTVRESELQAAIRRIAEPILIALGLVLVDVEARGRSTLIRLVIERSTDRSPSGEDVTIEDCERAHTLVGHALDVEDPISHPYVLEVSSPGLDRPIRTIAEYERFQGRLARFKLMNPLEGQMVVIGRLQKVEADCVWIELSAPHAPKRSKTQRRQLTSVALPLADIQEARLEVEF